MAELADLEARTMVLEDIEAIKKLKSKYWRCIDKKLWDELGECFAEDATIDYEVHGQIKGIEAIIDDFKERNSGARDSLIRIHQGHNAEIDITGAGTAKGIWQLFHYCIDPRTNRGVRLGGFYDDEYVKERGEWKLGRTKHYKVFREEFDREGISLID